MMRSTLLRPVSALYAVLIGLMPVLLLTSGGGSQLFYMLAVASLAVVAMQPAQAWQRLRPYRGTVLWLCLPLAAAVLSQVLNAEWRGSEVERGARVSLIFPLLLAALLALDAQILRWAMAGLAAAGVASAVVVLQLIWPDFGRPLTPQYNAVTYGNMMLFMAVVTAYGIAWPLGSRPRAERAIKIAAATFTFAGFVLTQTRTGWMAVPVFAAIGLLLMRRLRHPVRDLAVLAGVVAVVAVLGASSPALRERVQQGFEEVHQCQTVDRTANTSMCIRLQLWRATWDMFVSQPWSGMGSGPRFSEELRQRVSSGEVSRYVADNFGEPHNDMLLALASHGILGGLGLLAMYLAPAWLFLQRLRQWDAPPGARAAAAMGLALCLGFCIFGVTELMFRGMRSVGFYVVLLAWMMALSDPRQARVPASG
ncbi:O-antigen ligase family protein [Bordetella sp. 2513F-2]